MQSALAEILKSKILPDSSQAKVLNPIKYWVHIRALKVHNPWRNNINKINITTIFQLQSLKYWHSKSSVN